MELEEFSKTSVLAGHQYNCGALFLHVGQGMHNPPIQILHPPIDQIFSNWFNYFMGIFATSRS